MGMTTLRRYDVACAWHIYHLAARDATRQRLSHVGGTMMSSSPWMTIVGHLILCRRRVLSKSSRAAFCLMNPWSVLPSSSLLRGWDQLLSRVI